MRGRQCRVVSWDCGGHGRGLEERGEEGAGRERHRGVGEGSRGLRDREKHGEEAGGGGGGHRTTATGGRWSWRAARGRGPLRVTGCRRAVGQLLGPSPRSNFSLTIPVPTSVLPVSRTPVGPRPLPQPSVPCYCLLIVLFAARLHIPRLFCGPGAAPMPSPWEPGRTCLLGEQSMEALHSDFTQSDTEKI